jgi:8-oxo-dGTP pyrophosphatase MutT (NUDIX family)
VLSTETILHQAGVIAYRMEAGETRILLVTSRDTGRWVIPKGHVEPGFSPAQAAQKEAYEEAGVSGKITNATPLGFFTYFKRHPSGDHQAAVVEVYTLRVDKILKKFPERGQRRLSWVAASEGALLVEEEGLSRLMTRFQEIEDAFNGR